MRWPWQVWRSYRQMRAEAARYRWLLQLPGVKEAVDAEYGRQMVRLPTRYSPTRHSDTHQSEG